jgi:hypothetical protein
MDPTFDLASVKMCLMHGISEMQQVLDLQCILVVWQIGSAGSRLLQIRKETALFMRKPLIRWYKRILSFPTY